MFARVATFQTPGGTPGQIPGERRRALIVDDEAVFRTLITSAVSDFGFEARAIGSAHELADALEEFDPDIVMLDLALGKGRTVSICSSSSRSTTHGCRSSSLRRFGRPNWWELSMARSIPRLAMW